MGENDDISIMLALFWIQEYHHSPSSMQPPLQTPTYLISQVFGQGFLEEEEFEEIRFYHHEARRLETLI